MMFRPAFPKVPSAGKAKAAVLNHCPVEGELRCGSPTRLGRSLAPNPRIERPVPLLSISESKATVNGRPDCHVITPKLCHPLKSVEAHPLSAKNRLPSPKGRS